MEKKNDLHAGLTLESDILCPNPIKPHSMQSFGFSINFNMCVPENNAPGFGNLRDEETLRQVLGKKLCLRAVIAFSKGSFAAVKNGCSGTKLIFKM